MTPHDVNAPAPFYVRWTDTFDNSSAVFGTGTFGVGDRPRTFGTFEEAFAYAEEHGGTMFLCCVFDAEDRHLSCSGSP